MGDLISREALKAKLNEIFDTVEVVTFDDIIDVINNAPTVELFCSYLSDGVREPCVEAPCSHERPQGKKDIRKPYGWQFCSECGKVLEPQDKFCWFCGADFRETDNNVPTVKSPCNDCIELECEHHGVVCPHCRVKEADNVEQGGEAID